MTTIKNIILSIDELEREKANQEKTLKDSKGNVYIDVRDLLKNWEKFEANGIIEEYGIKSNSIENFLGNIDAVYGLEEIRSDNTYNYLAPVNYDIDFTMYECKELDKIYVALRVHKNGDIRGGYTDSIILQFNNDKDLSDNFYCNDGAFKTVSIIVNNENFNINLNLWSNEKEITDIEGNFITMTYNYEYEYIIKDILEAIEE